MLDQKKLTAKSDNTQITEKAMERKTRMEAIKQQSKTIGEEFENEILKTNSGKTKSDRISHIIRTHKENTRDGYGTEKKKIPLITNSKIIEEREAKWWKK